MASDKSPAFQFYPKDILSDDVVACMTNEQFGCYILLLSHAWLRPDGLPSGMASLAKLARCTESRFVRCIWDGIKSRFQLNAESRYFNDRMEEERQKQSTFKAERSQSGKRGAAHRWPEKVNGSAYGSAIGSATKQPLAKEHSSSASASASALKNVQPRAAEPRFDAFWTCYPKRIGKDAARKAFARRKVDDALLAVMLSALELQKASKQWQRDGGQFVPNPATWINQGRWQDEDETHADRPDFPLTSVEIAAAITARRLAGGACAHQPPCETFEACVETMARERRAERRAS